MVRHLAEITTQTNADLFPGCLCFLTGPLSLTMLTLVTRFSMVEGGGGRIHRDSADQCQWSAIIIIIVYVVAGAEWCSGFSDS